MKTTKILIVLAATAAIALSAIGIAYGHYLNDQTINTNAPYATNTDFWGWFRGCLGFGKNQPDGYQYQPPTDGNTEPPTTYVPPQYPCQQNPNQGYYQSGYGRGCWRWG